MPFIRNEQVGDEKVRIYDKPTDMFTLARDVVKSRTNNDAFILVSLDALNERLALWKKELPRVEPFYAIKANADDVFVRWIALLGLGFDAASEGEIVMAIMAGASPEKILYAHSIKEAHMIEFADRKKVNVMTFDTVEELDKMIAHHRHPVLILRITPKSYADADCPANLKFGADPVTLAPKILERARELGVNVCGISFHTGADCKDVGVFSVALQHTRNLFEIGARLGHKMNLVDMGGGFPGNEGDTEAFCKIADEIRVAIDKHFPDPAVRLIAEPGKFFSTAPFSVVTTVIGATRVPAHKITQNPADANRDGYVYYLNDGVYGTFSGVFSNHFHSVGQTLLEGTAEEYPTTIWGPTCSGLDRIEISRTMRKLNVGDRVLYNDSLIVGENKCTFECYYIVDNMMMGAYSTVASTYFNGFNAPSAEYVASEEAWASLNHP